MTTHIEINESCDQIPQEWFDLNYRLQDEAFEININKDFLEEWISRLMAMIHPHSHCFWLFLARINELALFCAAGYVDGCELDAAEDLLFDPDDLSGQTWDVPPTSSTCRIIREQGSRLYNRKGILGKEENRALISYLFELLQGSGYISIEYLKSVSWRIERIKDVLCVLIEQDIICSDDLSERLSCMNWEERKAFDSKICRFDRKIFNDMGRELHQFMRFGAIESRYMAEPVKNSSYQRRFVSFSNQGLLLS
ncbi:MAG: hypothetical protein JW896_13120 [Deltaproteobacteria bacterium]|nr:hypothetical protein [Deltaproteobacteria bacterium]